MRASRAAGERGANRTGRWVAAVLAFVLVGASAYWMGASQDPDPGGSSGPVATSPPAAGAPISVTPSQDPLQSAIAWLRGYRTQAWTDPQPWTWTTRVLPAVTGALSDQYRALRNADGGSEWLDYVARRCSTTVSAPGAVIPDEAPRSTTEVYVQVTGNAVTNCGTGLAPGGTSEQLAATVELVRGSDGLWRVRNRLY